EIADGLQIGLVLNQLLSPTVKQANVRIDAVHDLAVELQHQPQHTVRGRMLWPEVDVELANLRLGHLPDPSSRFQRDDPSISRAHCLSPWPFRRLEAHSPLPPRGSRSRRTGTLA